MIPKAETTRAGMIARDVVQIALRSRVLYAQRVDVGTYSTTRPSHLAKQGSDSPTVASITLPSSPSQATIYNMKSTAVWVKLQVGRRAACTVDYGRKKAVGQLGYPVRGLGGLAHVHERWGGQDRESRQPICMCATARCTANFEASNGV